MLLVDFYGNPGSLYTSGLFVIDNNVECKQLYHWKLQIDAGCDPHF